MCVAAIAWRADPRWPLVAIANRDEFHERPTLGLEDWGNGVLAGRDLEAGGTWLGVSATGRFALVTNYRVEGYPKSGLASRGGLVTGWLDSGDLPDGADMNPFHLVACDSAAAWHLTNQPRPVRAALAPGLHGVSNGAFDTPWPKTARLVSTLGDWIGAADASTEALFAALADETELPAKADSEGPMAQLSPVFIRSPVYGTRCSTVVTVDAAGQGRIEERRFNASGAPTGTTVLEFDWAMS